MPLKPTYEELLQRVNALEEENRSTWQKYSAAEVRELEVSKIGPLNKQGDSINGQGILRDIINAEELQSIMDDFYQLTGMVTAILDMDGNVIESTGWQDICTKFHRIHPKTAQNCTESDLYLVNKIKPGKFVEYKCKNGLWDVVTPLYIGNKHLGNIYTGQFFYDDDLVDENEFIQQAEKYGFDKDTYVDAFRRIPRYSRKSIKHLMNFLIKFTSYISTVSYTNIMLENEIRERKRAEDALQESEGRLRTLINALPDLVWLKDIDGIYLACNARFEKFFGAKEKEIVGKTDYDFMSKELADFFRSHDNAAIEKGGPNVNEEEIRFADDGHLEILETIKTPMCSIDGRISGVLGIGHDITERKAVENALKESEERFKALHNASFGGIAIHDKGVILECNKGLSEIFGYGYDELIGMNGLLLISDDTRDQVIQNIEAGYEQPYEATGVHKNGDQFPMRLEARNIPYKGKDVRVVEFRDITENKRAEKEREELEGKLGHAQKMEAVGRLAGGVAHDFNNMLSVIIGNTEIALEQANLPRSLYDNLVEIKNAGERSANLTRQLLAFARKQTISPKVLDLNKAIAVITKMLQRLMGENIELKWLPGKGVWPIKMDPSQIDQILANLCVNARDAIADVGKLTIETGNAEFDEDYCTDHPEFRPGEYVLLAVSDDGCGMAAETMGKIFEPFFTTKELGQGTGLGLSTVYGVVKQNNGFVNVYSEPGQGTTFKLYLPRFQTQTDMLTMKVTDAPAELGHETILLVEDEPAILRMTTMMLKSLGYQVMDARTPSEAIRLAQQFKGEIHLLLTDVIMPEMNGRDLASKILFFYPNLKRLFMSGYTANVIAHHGVLDKGLNFIQKPFSKKNLGAKVRETLDEMNNS